jgi:hypothetical protein
LVKRLGGTLRGSVEARDTMGSAGLCWVSNLNTSVQPVAVVGVSGLLFMVGNCGAGF